MHWRDGFTIKKIHLRKRKSNVLLVFLIVFLLLFRVFTLVADFVETVVNISPLSKVVTPGSNFTLNVSCIPGQPIKSFELKLSFNPSVLEATNVSEGNIFSGYSTFFNDGIINNTAGTIINVYCLILGAGNVSAPGNLVSIKFTAKQLSGTSPVSLYDIGLTNESEYVSLVVNNGTVLVDGTPPTFTDFSPALGYTGDSYTFNVSVIDDVCSPENLSVWTNWSHGTKGSNDSMVHVGSNYFEKTVILDLNSTANMDYIFYAKDIFGNSNLTLSSSVFVQDNDPPQISDVSASPGVQEVGGSVNLSCVVVDNIGVNQVYLNITYPTAASYNISITANKTGNTYYYNKTHSIIGLYTYIIWTDDTNGLGSISTGNSFLIGDNTLPEISNIGFSSSSPLDTNLSFGWVNITGDVTDNVAVNLVRLNITTPSGSFNNISMNTGGASNYYYNSSTTFSQHGNFSYFIWANDSIGNSNNSQIVAFSMPPNWDIDMNGECKVFDLTLVSNQYGGTGTQGWIREDVDNNGEVQILDLVLVSNHYNESWWV